MELSKCSNCENIIFEMVKNSPSGNVTEEMDNYSIGIKIEEQLTGLKIVIKQLENNQIDSFRRINNRFDELDPKIK